MPGGATERAPVHGLHGDTLAPCLLGMPCVGPRLAKAVRGPLLPTWQPITLPFPPLSAAAAADGSVGRREALALLRSWYLGSLLPQQPGLSPKRSSLVVSPRSHHGAGGAGGGEEEEAARLWRDDAAFLGWVEGASGAARIAMELKVGVHRNYGWVWIPKGTVFCCAGLAQHAALPAWRKTLGRGHFRHAALVQQLGTALPSPPAGAAHWRRGARCAGALEHGRGYRGPGPRAAGELYFLWEAREL